MAKKWKKKNIKLTEWLLHVQTTTNNTIITLTDNDGNKVAWGGTWLQGFKWAKQNTPYVAEITTKGVLKEAEKYGLEKVWIIFKGVWMWREWVFKAVNETGTVEISYISEKTPIQFGGCRGIRPKRN